MELREENCDLREKLMQSFMDAITQSLLQDEADQSHWSELSQMALLETFKKLIESGFTILDIRNP